MKLNRLAILLVFVLINIFSSCSPNSTVSYIGTKHYPILFDGTRIYGGMGTGILSYVSTTSGTYSPLCTNPTCSHLLNSSSCEAHLTNNINAFTLDGNNHIIISGRDMTDPHTYSAIKIDLNTGKREFVIEKNPNNISAMMVINDKLYFLSQLDGGNENDNLNEGNNSVCFIPLNGGKIEVIDLPKNDYYFAGADDTYLYLKGAYTQSIIAVNYLENYSHHTFYTFDETESSECYIHNNSLFVFNNRTKTDIIPQHENFPDIDSSLIKKNYTLYSLAHYDIESNRIIGETTSQYIANPWGYVSENFIYLPHFSPECAAPREDSSGNIRYPVYRNTGIDIIDISTMEVIETLETPGTDINAIVYADNTKIIYYSNRYEDQLMYYMGWLDRNTNEIHEFDIFWEDSLK